MCFGTKERARIEKMTGIPKKEGIPVPALFIYSNIEVETYTRTSLRRIHVLGDIFWN